MLEVAENKPLYKEKLADKRIPHKGIFPTLNSVVKYRISYSVFNERL